MRARMRCLGCALIAGAMLWAAPAWATGADVREATEDQKKAAQEKFAEARIAFDTRRFVDAIAGFRASYDIVASPNTHLMIAHAMRELGRNAEAYDVLGAVAAEARKVAETDDRYQDTVKLAEEEQAALRAEIALVRVEIADPEPSATLSIGGRAVASERWSEPIAIDPGEVTLVYEGSHGPIVRKATLAAGSEQTIRFEAPKPEPVPKTVPEPQQPPPDDGGWQWTGTQRYIAYGVAGLGVASFVVAGVTGGIAQSTHSDLESACGDQPCPDRQSDIDSGRAMMITSNATLIAGAVLVGAGAALFFTAPNETDDAAQAQVHLRVGPGALTLEGTF